MDRSAKEGFVKQPVSYIRKSSFRGIAESFCFFTDSLIMQASFQESVLTSCSLPEAAHHFGKAEQTLSGLKENVLL